MVARMILKVTVGRDRWARHVFKFNGKGRPAVGPYLTTSREKSTARAECVRAPTEM